MSVRSIPEIADQPVEEMNNRAEVRLRIAQDVGIKTRYDTPFTKADLNAIYAFLAGEHFFPKRWYNTSQSPPIGRLREQVAIEASVDEYIPDPDMDDDPEGRPYRREELESLCRTVEDSSDQRPQVEKPNKVKM